MTAILGVLRARYARWRAQRRIAITSGGNVTLRGPVKSEQEKGAVEAKAKQVAGVTAVNNLLEVETH